MKSWWIGRIAKVFLFVVLGAAVFGFGVMLLWNALIPDLFNGPVLTFWQAVGLLVLAHVMFHGHGRWHYSRSWRHDRWRRKFDEKLAAMTPEEREKFKAEWSRRCGPGWGEPAEKTSEAKA